MKWEEAECLAEDRLKCKVVLEECTSPILLLSLPNLSLSWSCSCLSQYKVLAGAKLWESLLAA